MTTEPSVQESFPDRARGFSLALRGHHLELTVFPPARDARPVAAAVILEAVADYPVEGTAERVMSAIREHAGIPVTIADIGLADRLRDWEVQVSANRMVAYLVPAVAVGEPGSYAVDLSEATLRAAMVEAEIDYGVDEDAVTAFRPGAPADSIIVVARGSRSVTGQNARIDFTFNTQKEATPILREDGSVDHHAAASRTVDAGAVLAVRYPPIAGEPGTDVFGHRLPIAQPIDRPLAPLAGAGTRIDGDTLVADRSGRPVMNGGRIEVLVIFEVKGDLDYSVGNIDFSGDVIIGGDVLPGFSIHADGSVTIRGIIDRASVEAGHELVARGVVGDGRLLVTAGTDMNLGYAHQANIAVGGTLTVSREMVGCTVFAGKVQTSPSGRIVGGEVTAREDITAAVLGSLQEVPTLVTIEHGGPAGDEPVIRAMRTVHAGTRISFGRAVLRITDDMPGSSFWEVDGEIKRLASTAVTGRAA